MMKTKSIFRRSRFVLGLGLLCLGLFAGGGLSPAAAQDFGDLQLPDGLGDFGLPGGSYVTLTAEYEVDSETRTADVRLNAEVELGWHIFSLTQATGPLPTKIEVTSPAGGETKVAWQPTRDPESHFDGEVFNTTLEEHRGLIGWTASLVLPEGFDPEQDSLTLSFKGQACTDEIGQCVDVDETVTVAFAGYATAKEAVTRYAPGGAHVVFSGTASPGVVKPGDLVTVELVGEPTDEFHLYSIAREQAKGANSAPTIIALTRRHGWEVSEPQASLEPIREETGLKNAPYIEYYDKPVSLTFELLVPKDAEAGEYSIEGLLGFQTCDKESCDLPQAARFAVSVMVGESGDETTAAVVFEDFAGDEGNGYAEVNELAAEMEWGIVSAVGPVSLQLLIGYLAMAFAAGLILNVMPCVLPVIGLKIMSLVSQAGAHRAQIFWLNFWLAVGMMSVFLTLGTLAVMTGLAWGGQFSNLWFTISMISIVFVFGLSFLGVWEVPIPGFAGSSEASKLTEREGAIGAFFKGVLSTVLATPCAGPMLVPAMAWAVSQPPTITYAMFVSLGLGMASPYLVIGLFPSTIRWLPKPGEWMVTFKEVMGFIMIGVAVWLLSTLPQDYRVAMMGIALFLGVFCWWIGRIPAGSETRDILKGWAGGVAIIAVGGWMSLVLLGPGNPEHELEWEPFDPVALEQRQEEGQTVFVDFTADWCLTCKANEHSSLNTKATKEFFKEYGIVAMKADKTQPNPQIDQMLNRLGNPARAIPFYAIFPADGGEPLTFNGVLTPGLVQEKFVEAGVEPLGVEEQAESSTVTQVSY